jgi:hypothetical protein
MTHTVLSRDGRPVNHGPRWSRQYRASGHSPHACSSATPGSSSIEQSAADGEVEAGEPRGHGASNAPMSMPQRITTPRSCRSPSLMVTAYCSARASRKATGEMKNGRLSQHPALAERTARCIHFHSLRQVSHPSIGLSCSGNVHVTGETFGSPRHDRARRFSADLRPS